MPDISAGHNCSTAAGVSQTGAQTGLQLMGHGSMQEFDPSFPEMFGSQRSWVNASRMQTISTMFRHVVADSGFAVKTLPAGDHLARKAI